MNPETYGFACGCSQVSSSFLSSSFGRLRHLGDPDLIILSPPPPSLLHIILPDHALPLLPTYLLWHPGLPGALPQPQSKLRREVLLQLLPETAQFPRPQPRQCRAIARYCTQLQGCACTCTKINCICIFNCSFTCTCARLLHPQRLDGIWTGKHPYRLPYNTLSEYPEP